MKKIYLALFTLAAFASCKKSDLPVDNGCISQIKRLNFMVPAADSTAAVALLKQNNLPVSDIAFEYIHNDTITNATPPYVSQYIFGIQYINGLPVLSDDFGYTFKNGVYQQTTGNKYGPVNQDARSTQSLPRLRQLYIAQVKANLDGTTAAAYKDTCLVAEFGYYNLNVSSSNAAPNIVKAWRVSRKNGGYPQATFRDDNGGKISYYSGLIEF